MAKSRTWALGLDIGNAKLKLFALDEAGNWSAFSAALPWSGRNPYNRKEDFESGIREGLSVLLAERNTVPACAVFVLSSGYSYATHADAARHAMRFLSGALPKTNVRALGWDGTCVDSRQIGKKAGLLACTNGTGAVHLALRIANWPGAKDGLVVDAGGTTTQITPIVNGRIDPAALSNPAKHLEHRARYGKLAWIGSRTTPVESLTQEVCVGARVFPVIPRGVTLHEVVALLGLLPKVREERLRLFHAAPEKASLYRAVADSIGVDPSIISKPELLELARKYLRSAIKRLAQSITQALGTAPKASSNVLVFGLAARALAVPSLRLVGIDSHKITLAEDALAPELSDLASVYGAAHAALELVLGRELDAAIATKRAP